MSFVRYECLNDIFCTLWMSERCLFVRFWCTQILEIDRGSIDLDFSMTSYVCYEILKSLQNIWLRTSFVRYEFTQVL